MSGSAFLDAALEVIAICVRHPLEENSRLVIQRGGDRSHVDLRSRFHRIGDQVELSHGVLKIEMIEHDTESACHGGGMSHDPVALGGEEIGARRGQVHQASDHGFMSLGAELAKLFGHDVAGGDASARAVDPQQDRRDLRISGGRVELIAESGQRIVTHRIETAEILIQEQAVDVDERNPRTARLTGLPAQPSRSSRRDQRRTEA